MCVFVQKVPCWLVFECFHLHMKEQPWQLFAGWMPLGVALSDRSPHATGNLLVRLSGLIWASFAARFDRGFRFVRAASREPGFLAWQKGTLTGFASTASPARSSSITASFSCLDHHHQPSRQPPRQGIALVPRTKLSSDTAPATLYPLRSRWSHSIDSRLPVAHQPTHLWLTSQQPAHFPPYRCRYLPCAHPLTSIGSLTTRYGQG